MRPRKPFWPAALRVDPVHLQASDTYRERLRARALRRILPDAYGIAEMDYDPDALAGGSLVFRRLDVTFPSGLEATLDDDVPPLEADVQSRLYGLTSSTSVYVGVPKLVLNGPNLSPDGKGARSTRYVGTLDAEVPWMRPNLEILFEDDPKGRHELVAIGRVQRVGASIRFAPSSWPTVLHARACTQLVAAIRDVVAALQRRRSELLREREMHGFGLTSLTFPESALDLMVLIGRSLARLRGLLEVRSASPHAFYECLQTLYLGLMAFESESEAEQPPLYKHEALGDVFPWLVTRILPRVDTVARAPVTQLPFTRLDAYSFALSFRREDLLQKRPILVAVYADDDFLERIPRLIKLAAPFAIEELKLQSTSGVRLDIDTDPPPHVPRGRGIAAYRILRDRPGQGVRAHWADIMGCHAIHAYLPQAPATLQLHLFGVPWDA
ncbi:type VI secretion system baseplate subunit TssK [Pendulispora albinea]|uniref:Type VI secretion system baseplate subunit TssK n=1 Tax=Pendulispora albinea TaxID=2741071 RepID=A0ABZ2LS33_9BACT